MKIPNFTQDTMHNYRMVVFFMMLLIGSGLYSLWKMPKQEFPEFSMPIGMVVAVYPGASAEEVEQQVTNRLEDYLFSFSEVNAVQVRSTSSDGMCSITVMLNDKGAKNPEIVWGRIRDGFPLLQKTVLPAGVLAVALLDNFGDAAAELVVLESKDKSYRELDQYASRLKDDLQDIKGIANLRKQGVLHEQLSIYLDKERMVRFGVNSTMITAMLALQGITTGGAHVDTGHDDLPIYVDLPYGTERELADQIVLSAPNGKIVRLKDVARVVNEYPEVNSYITNNGQRAVLLCMEMQQGGDIIAFGDEVDRRVDDFAKTLPESVHLGRIANQPAVVAKSIVSFLGDLAEAVAIVVLVMMLLFPIRSAMVAGMSIPLTIVITFALMNVGGVPLNNVTLAALIVALGMVVDDSIIVIDGHQQMLRQGHSRWYASVMSAHTYFPSMAIATFSICLVFVPTLLFMPELFSNFFSVFTDTLIFALVTSLVVAMLVVPMLNHKLLGRSGAKAKAQKESRLLAPIQKGYEKILDRCFAHPWLTVTVCTATIAAGAWLFTRVPQKMIPNADRDQFVIEIHNPNGTSIDRTAAITDSVASVMKRDGRVVDVTEFVGQLMPRFMVSAPIAMGRKSFSQIIVRTTDEEATLDVIRDYTGHFERQWPDTYVRMYQLSYAFGNGLCVMLEGDDLAGLHQAADSVKAFMRTLDGLQWIHDGFGEAQPVTDISLDPISAAQLGVTRFSVAGSMAMHFGGFKAGSIWEDGYEKPVVLYTANREAQHDVSSIGDEYVGTTFGGNVPLRQIAQVKPGWREANIMHTHGKRSVTVEADIKPGYSQAKAMKAVNRYVNTQLAQHMPQGVKSRPWGAARMNKEIGEPLAKSFAVSLCVILLVMVLNFKRFRLSLLAMCGTLLALPGAAVGLWLSGSDFSMTAMLGVFSLLGIVMRNSVIMFDYAEELRMNGVAVREAAMEAGRRRMIPIFLTSATTAVGVLPLMLSKSTLWPSMGWIICFGTITATLLVVTVMPCAYWKLMERRKDK